MNLKGLNGAISVLERIVPVSGSLAVEMNNLGLTEIVGGLTLASLSGSTLADGDNIGQLKVIRCLGTLTTNGHKVTLATAGKQLAVNTGTGVPLALASITFDALDEVAILEWTGLCWQLVDYSGCTLAAS